MTYFVTETYLKSKTDISSNADVKFILPHIQTNSDMWIQPILGTYFYEYLLDAFNDQTLTSDEEVLVNKIKPIISWRALSDATYALSRKVTNKGIQRQDGEFSQGVELGEIGFAMERYTKKAEFYSQRLINYLVTNKALFPEFTSAENKDSDIKPKEDNNNNYDSTLMFI
jgi:hypothetical protein